MAFDASCTLVTEIINDYDYRSEAEGKVTNLPGSKLVFDSKHGTLYEMSHEIYPDITHFEDEGGNLIQDTRYLLVSLSQEVFQNGDWAKLKSIKVEHVELIQTLSLQILFTFAGTFRSLSSSTEKSHGGSGCMT